MAHISSPLTSCTNSGMESILARIPDGGRYYLTVDLDGMDPSIRRQSPARARAG